MYRKNFSLLAAASVCVALALLGTPRLAEADPPETVEIMFGLYIPAGWWYPYPIPDPYYVGEDTIAILTGQLWPDSGFSFVHESPAVGQFDDAEGQIEVKDTFWDYCGPATILNIRDPTEALVYVNVNSMPPWPPAHYPLLFDEITEVHTSWIAQWYDWVWVQESFSPETTSGVFIIVKAKFRVKQ